MLNIPTENISATNKMDYIYHDNSLQQKHG